MPQVSVCASYCSTRRQLSGRGVPDAVHVVVAEVGELPPCQPGAVVTTLVPTPSTFSVICVPAM